MQSVLSSLRSPLHESMRSWGVSEAVAGALRSLWPLADRGLKHARAALNAALGAWDALVRGAADAYERVVSLLNWLGFTVVSDDLVGSAMVVLADADRWWPVRLFSVADERGAVARLRRLVLIENRRVTRLSIDPDRRLRGYPLRSLDESVELDDVGTTVALRELVVDRAAVGPEVDEPVITHPGLAAVWSKLTDRERDLLLEKSSRPHTTWPAAAAAGGVSREEAERLRRKIKHLLGRGLRRRAEQRGIRVRARRRRWLQGLFGGGTVRCCTAYCEVCRVLDTGGSSSAPVDLGVVLIYDVDDGAEHSIASEHLVAVVHWSLRSRCRWPAAGPAGRRGPRRFGAVNVPAGAGSSGRPGRCGRCRAGRGMCSGRPG